MTNEGRHGGNAGADPSLAEEGSQEHKGMEPSRATDAEPMIQGDVEVLQLTRRGQEQVQQQ